MSQLAHWVLKQALLLTLFFKIKGLIAPASEETKSSVSHPGSPAGHTSVHTTHAQLLAVTAVCNTRCGCSWKRTLELA